MLTLLVKITQVSIAWRQKHKSSLVLGHSLSATPVVALNSPFGSGHAVDCIADRVPLKLDQLMLAALVEQLHTSCLL